jgi:hypothetical protein
MRASALVLGLLASGCSFALVSRAPDFDPGVRPIGCTEDRTVPVVDAVIAAATIVGGAAVISATDVHGQSNDAGIKLYPALGMLSLLIGAPFGVSAYVGYSRTSRCRALNQTAPMFSPPPGYGPPPPYGAPPGYGVQSPGQLTIVSPVSQ